MNILPISALFYTRAENILDFKFRCIVISRNIDNSLLNLNRLYSQISCQTNLIPFKINCGISNSLRSNENEMRKHLLHIMDWRVTAF